MRCTERDSAPPKSETDSDQSQFIRSRVLRSQCLRRRTVGTPRTLQGTSLQRVSSSRGRFRPRQDTFYSAGDQGGLEHIEIRCLATLQWIREKRLSVSRVDTKNNTGRSLHETSGWIAKTVAREKNLAFESWMVRMVLMATTEEW